MRYRVYVGIQGRIKEEITPWEEGKMGRLGKGRELLERMKRQGEIRGNTEELNIRNVGGGKRKRYSGREECWEKGRKKSR